jgi:hypothetical protein
LRWRHCSGIRDDVDAVAVIRVHVIAADGDVTLIRGIGQRIVYDDVIADVGAVRFSLRRPHVERDFLVFESRASCRPARSFD